MTETSSRLQRKFRTAAYLLTAGLLIEGISLYWSHPISFLLFICLGGVLVGAGVAVYLIALVSP